MLGAMQRSEIAPASHPRQKNRLLSRSKRFKIEVLMVQIDGSKQGVYHVS